MLKQQYLNCCQQSWSNNIECWSADAGVTWGWCCCLLLTRGHVWEELEDKVIVNNDLHTCHRHAKIGLDTLTSENEQLKTFG